MGHVRVSSNEMSYTWIHPPVDASERALQSQGMLACSDGTAGELQLGIIGEDLAC